MRENFELVLTVSILVARNAKADVVPMVEVCIFRESGGWFCVVAFGRNLDFSRR